MSHLTPIIFIFLAVKNADASVRPIVTLDPNWNPVYSGDKVTLSCMVGSPKSGKHLMNDYEWYKDGRFHIYGEKKEFTAKFSDIGAYKCSYKRGTHSVPVQLRVIDQEYLILQTPPAVVEGDHLSLRCHSRDKYKTDKETTFYKDDEKWVITDDILHIPNVTTAATGKYKCHKYLKIDYKTNKWISAEEYVTVEELMTTPKIQTNPSFIRESDDVTLTCVTKCSALREGTELHFSFYRNGRTVRGLNVSDTYRVRSSQLEDSGNYTCEVRTVSDTVRKMSDELYIQIRELFPSPEIRVDPSLPVNEGERITLKCVTGPIQRGTTLLYTFYKDSQIIQSADRKTSYVIGKAGEENSGRYQCSVQSRDGKVRKNSTEVHILVQKFPTPEIRVDPSLPVNEGERVTMECVSDPIQSGTTLLYTFYKDSQIIRIADRKTSYVIGKAGEEHSGRYHCSVQSRDRNVRRNSTEVHIPVQNLFSRPEIQTGPYSIHEGDAMIVTCHTRLNPLRAGTELHYTFYRDGRTVRGYNVSDTYRVRSSQLEDSGNYTCEVRTTSDTVKKNSNTLHIQIQELFTTPKIRVVPSHLVKEGEQVTLECVTDPKERTRYLFYKDSQIIQSADIKNIYVIDKAKEENTGSYQCSVQSQDGNVRKNSTNIYILVQSITITVDKDNKDFVYGESLTLNCSIKKGMSPVFLWLHNETVVEKDSEFYQLRDSGKVLYIKSLQSHYAGTYSCKVSNNLADNKPFYIVETFEISQILESHPLGSNIIWPILGVLALLLLLVVVVLLFVKRRKLSSLFPLLSHQQNSESTFDKDHPRDDGRSANEGTNGPDETDNNQHLYGNVSSQQEEDDISYTYIDISKIKG
ncbi:Fc receptor-like protein 3 isoform X2 [Aquarana catesbeiana]